MHEWFLPEVLLLIFEYVYDPIRTNEDSQGRITVAGLARTCRAFKEPALDVLWAQLHSLDALVLCSGGRLDGNGQLVRHHDFSPSYHLDRAFRYGIVHCMMRTGAFSRIMENASTC